MGIILHIARRHEWEASASSGYYKPPSLDSDGFIHCSAIDQTVETADQFYSGQRDLVLLCIDESKVDAGVKYEAPARIGDRRVGPSFPHIYGLLNVSAVVEVMELVPNADGKFTLPAGIRKYFR